MEIEKQIGLWGFPVDQTLNEIVTGITQSTEEMIPESKGAAQENINSITARKKKEKKKRDQINGMGSTRT